MELLNARKMRAGYTMGMKPDGRELLMTAEIRATYYIPSFSALLSPSSSFLSLSRASSPAKKTWLRIGIIFALVVVATFTFRPK